MSGLSPALLGGLIGLVFGIVGFLALRRAADKIDERSAADGPVGGQQSTTAKIVRLAALFDLVFFPALGYFVGPLAFG